MIHDDGWSIVGILIVLEILLIFGQLFISFLDGLAVGSQK